MFFFSNGNRNCDKVELQSFTIIFEENVIVGGLDEYSALFIGEIIICVIVQKLLLG